MSPSAESLSKMMRGDFSKLPVRPSYSATVTATEAPDGSGESMEVEEMAEVGAEGIENAGPDDAEVSKIAVGYVSPMQKCSSCSHYDGAKCGLHGFECEPDGGCPDHEAGASEPEE